MKGPSPYKIIMMSEDGRIVASISLNEYWFPLVIHKTDIGLKGHVYFTTSFNSDSKGTELCIQQFRTIESYKKVYGRELERPGMKA